MSTKKARYMKERRRIQSQVSRMKKAGYRFNEPVLPPIPKTITEGSIRRLKKLDKDTIYAKAVYEVKKFIAKDKTVVDMTVEVYPGKAARAQRRWKATKEKIKPIVIEEMKPETPDVGYIEDEAEEVDLPVIRWDQLPNDVRKWRRNDASCFLYINAGLGALSSIIDLNRMKYAEDGVDHDAQEYFKRVLSAVAPSISVRSENGILIFERR